MRNRFARGAKQGVGVHFIVWDNLVPRFKKIQDKYYLLKDMPTEIAFMGDDLTFFHAGSANKWSYGIEIRNVGKVLKSSSGQFFWNRGKNRYHGREPIKVGASYWEPYTKAQMKGVLWVNRLMAAVHPIRPERFLGHTHVSSTRIDPGPHFPIHAMREYSVLKSNIPMNDVPFLKEFSEDPDCPLREDSGYSETELHAGLFRYDWDGRPDDWNEDPSTAPDLPDKADRNNYQSILKSLGYYVTPETLPDTVALFRSRWKERNHKGRGFRNMLPSAGGMDTKALQLLTTMVRQWDRL